MEALMAKFPAEAGLQAYVEAEVVAWETDLGLGKVLESHQKRVIRRLALVGAAGALAVCLGVFGIPESEVRRSVEFVRDAWLSDESNKPEGARAVEAIKATILRDRARFRPCNDEGRIVHDLLGYEDRKGGGFLLTDEGFAEACQGLSRDLALEELQRQGLLFTNEAGRKKAKQNVPGVGRIRVYVVRAEILEMEAPPA